MCKTTDSQDLKLIGKTEIESLKFYTVSILLQTSISGMPMVEASLTLLFLYQTQHVSCSKFGILSGVSCAIKFLFLDLICFMAETLLQTSMRNFSVTEAYFC